MRYAASRTAHQSHPPHGQAGGQIAGASAPRPMRWRGLVVSVLRRCGLGGRICLGGHRKACLSGRLVIDCRAYLLCLRFDVCCAGGRSD